MDNSVSLSRVLAWCQYLRTLPRRTRRALQRTCKQSLAGVALLFALGHAPAEAATIVVNASCRLGQAIRAANTDTATGGCPRGNGTDTIILPTGSTQTLTTVNNTTLGPTGLPVINSRITIEGRNSTIRRGSTAPDFRIFAVGSTGNLTLKETTVSGGLTTLGSPGGGVLNMGALMLQNSVISGNSSGGSGGGVENSGRLTIRNSTLSNNLAYNGDGGGVDNRSSATIENSTLSGNVVSSDLDNGGGGVANSGTLTLTNSTIAENSLFTDYGSGGGVLNSGRVTLTNSTVVDNGGHYGGGVVNVGGVLTLTRTVVSGNTSTNAIDQTYQVEVSSSGTITANAFNLFGHASASGVSGFSPGPTDVVPSVPRNAILATTLANNGGRTRTHALVPGSPALNAVASGCPPPATDQRGLPRPQGPRCDIGAVEAAFCGGTNFVTILGTSSNNVLTGTPGNDVIAGLGGNDTLDGLGGNDVLCGGEGNDTLRGNSGADLLFGEPGNDWLFGGPGQDQLFGQRGNDQLFGGPDNDALDGGPDDDGLNGEAGVDRCDGGLPINGDTAVNCETVLNVP